LPPPPFFFKMRNSQVIFQAIWITETVYDLSDCSTGERRNDRHIREATFSDELTQMCSVFPFSDGAWCWPQLLCLMRAATVYVFMSWCLTLESNMVTLCTTKFNIQKVYILPTQLCVFCMDLSDYVPVQHSLTCFYNRDEVCLLRCTKWIFKYNFVPWLRRLVAGLAPRKPGFDPRSFPVRFVVNKVALGQVFPCQCHSTNAPYSSSPTCCSSLKDKRAKPGNLQTSTFLPDTGE